MRREQGSQNTLSARGLSGQRIVACSLTCGSRCAPSVRRYPAPSQSRQEPMKACGVMLVVSLLSGCRLTRGEQPAASPTATAPEPNPCRAEPPAAPKPDIASGRIPSFEDFLRQYKVAAPELRGELARAF